MEEMKRQRESDGEENNSHFSKVPLAPPDPIFGLNQSFLEDKDPIKVNLGIGAYRDDNGKPYVLESVKQVCYLKHSLWNFHIFPNGIQSGNE
jgi:hypothetical protein